MFCNQDAYAQQISDRKSLQLRGIHAQAGSASRKSISKYNYLKPYFDYDFSDTRSSQIAHDFLRYIKETRKHKKETPLFVEDILNKILYLHKYNLKVAEVTFKYPLTKNFKQLLLHYIVLQCNVLYRRGCYPPRYEINIEAKIIRLLLNIYNSYYESLMSTTSEKLLDESIKAVLGLLVRIKTEFDMQNKLIENIVIKLLNKSGKLEKLRALQKTCISDTHLNDPLIRNSCKNIITSDYGTDDDLKIDDACVQVDTEELNSNNDNIGIDIKLEDDLITPSNKWQQKQETKFTSVPTIYIDDDDVQMVCWEEEVKKSSKSLKREEEQKQKELILREKQNKAFTNHRPILYTTDVKEEVIDLALSSEDDLCSPNISCNKNTNSVINNIEERSFLNEIIDDDEKQNPDLPIISNKLIKQIGLKEDETCDNTINKESDKRLLRIGELSNAKTDNAKLLGSYCQHEEEGQDLRTGGKYKVTVKRNLFASCKRLVSNTSSYLPEMIPLEEGEGTLKITKETVEERNIPSELISTNVNKNSFEVNFSTNKIYEENNELERFESYYVIEASKANILKTHYQDPYKVQSMLEISNHNEQFIQQNINDECNLQDKNTLSVIEPRSVKIALDQITTNNASKVHGQSNEPTEKSIKVNFVEKMQTNRVNEIELVQKRSEELNQQSLNKSYFNIEGKCAEIEIDTRISETSGKIALEVVPNIATDETTLGGTSEGIQSSETKEFEEKSIEPSETDLKVLVSEEASTDQVINSGLNQRAAVMILSKSEEFGTTTEKDSVGMKEPLKVKEASEKKISDKKFIGEITNEYEISAVTKITSKDICSSSGEPLKDINVKAIEMPITTVYEKEKIKCIETSHEKTTDQEVIGIEKRRGKAFAANKSISSDETVIKSNTLKDINPVEQCNYKKALIIEELVEQSSCIETEQLCNISHIHKAVELKQKYFEENNEELSDAHTAAEKLLELYNKSDNKISQILCETLNENVTLADEHTIKDTRISIEQSSTAIPETPIQFDGINNVIDSIEPGEKHELAEENWILKSATEQYIQKTEINQSSPVTSQKTLVVQNTHLTTDRIIIEEQVFEEKVSNVSKNCDYRTENVEIKQEFEILNEEQMLEKSTDDTEASFETEIEKLENKSDIRALEKVDNDDKVAFVENFIEIVIEEENDTEKKSSNQEVCEEAVNNIDTSLEGDVEENANKSTKFTEESIEKSIRQNIDTFTDNVMVKETIIETTIEKKGRISSEKSVQDTSIENASTDQSIERVTLNENNILTGENIEKVNRPQELETLNNNQDIPKKSIENTEDSSMKEMEKKSSNTVEKSLDNINLYQEINVDVTSNDARITSKFLGTDTNEQSVEENISLITDKVCVEEKFIDSNIKEEFTEDTAEVVEKIGQINQEKFTEVTESNKNKTTRAFLSTQIIEEENSGIAEVLNEEMSIEDKIHFEVSEPNKSNMVEPNSFVQLIKEVTIEGTINQNKTINMKLMNNDNICKDNEILSEHEDSSKDQFIINVSSSFEDIENGELNTNKSKAEDSFDNLYEDAKEKFMNELNIQMEEIITETDVFEANISEQMVSAVTSDSISQIINPIETHFENEESIEIISRTIPTPAISLDASDSLLAKIDALKKIGTEILVANNDKGEPKKIVQSLEICQIPNENTFLDILATVASEVPRQDLLKTKKNKKGTRRGRKKHNMSKSKSVVRKSKQIPNVESNFNRKCKPHDFFHVSNSDVPPPANNVYTHKLPDIAVTSEDSNDSEGNLLIDEDVDTKNNKHSKEVIEENIIVGCDLKQTDILTLYDEDTFEENVTFACESRVKGAVLISIPDNDQENFDILKQMEEMELCSSNNLGNVTCVRGSIKKNKGVHENISDNITPNIKKDFSVTDVEINERDVDKLETNCEVLVNAVYEKQINNQQLPSENRNVIINTYKPLNSWKPIRTMAERKDYDKFKFNPYVSIERLNFCCKMEKEEKCKRTRSKSFDIGMIRNSERTYLDASDPWVVSLNEKNVAIIPNSEHKFDIQESFCDVSNTSRNSIESNLTFSPVALKSSTHYMSDDNLPLAKLKENLETESHNKEEIDGINLDDIPLLLRKQINSGEYQRKKCSPRNVKRKKGKAVGQKVDKNQMYDQNITTIIKSKDDISETNVTKAFRSQTTFDNPNDSVCMNIFDDVILSETGPTAIAKSDAKEFTTTDTDSNSRPNGVTSALTKDENFSFDKKDNPVLNLAIEHKQNVLSKSENEFTSNKTLTKPEKDNNNKEDTIGNSNSKYYTTPKFRRKSMSRDNLNRIEGNSVDSASLKSTTTTGEKKLTFNTDKKYYAPPKFRRKSVIKSESIFIEDTSRKTTPKQINLSSKIDILSKCKNTVSPTTEKLKKKLEIEFKLNCEEIKFDDDIPNNLEWSSIKSTVNDTAMVERTDKECEDQLKEKHIISRGKSKQNKSRNKSKSIFKTKEDTATSANQKTKGNYDISINASNEKNICGENIEIDLAHLDKEHCINDGTVLNVNILGHPEISDQPNEDSLKSEPVQTISNRKEVEIVSSEIDSENILDRVSQLIHNEDTDKSETLDNSDIFASKCASSSNREQPVYRQESEAILVSNCGRQKCENISDEINIELDSTKTPESLLLNPSVTVKKINKIYIQQIENNEHFKSRKVENEKSGGKLQILLPDQDVQQESLELHQISQTCMNSGLSCDKNGEKSVNQNEDKINDLDDVPLLERALRFLDLRDTNVKLGKKVKRINKKHSKSVSVTNAVMGTKTQKDKKTSKANSNNIKTHKEKALVQISESIQSKSKLDEDNSDAKLVSKRIEKKMGNNQNSLITLATNKHQTNEVDSFEKNYKNPVAKLSERTRKSRESVDGRDSVKNNKDTHYIGKLYENKSYEKPELDGKKKKKAMDIDKQSKDKDIKKNEQVLKIDKTSKETKKSNMDKLKTTLIQRSTDQEILPTVESDPIPTSNMSLRKNDQTISTSETVSCSISKAHGLDNESKRKGHDTKSSENTIKKSDKSKSFSSGKSEYKKQRDRSKKHYKSDSRSNSDASSPPSNSATPTSEHIYGKSKDNNKSKSRSSSISSYSGSSKLVTPNILEQERHKPRDQGRSKRRHDHSQPRSLSKISQSSISASDRNANRRNDEKKSLELRSSSTSERVCKLPTKGEIKTDLSITDNFEKRNKISSKEKRKKNKEESHAYSKQTDKSPAKRRKIHDNKDPENVACDTKICTDGKFSKPNIKHKKDTPKASKVEGNLELPTECTPVNLESECQSQDFVDERNKIVENEDAFATNNGTLKEEVIELKPDSEQDTNYQDFVIEKAVPEEPLLNREVQQHVTISESLSEENMIAKNVQKAPAELEEKLKVIIEDRGAKGLEKSCTNLESDRHLEMNGENTQNLETMEMPKNAEGSHLIATDHILTQCSETQESEMIAQEVAAPKLLITEDIINYRNGEESPKLEENVAAIGQDDTSDMKSVSTVDNTHTVIEATCLEEIATDFINAETSKVEVNKESTSILKQNSTEIMNNHIAQVSDTWSGSDEFSKDCTNMELLNIDNGDNKNLEKTSSKLEQNCEELEKDNIYLKNDHLNTLSEEKCCEMKNEEVTKRFSDLESLNMDVNEKTHKLQQNAEEIENKGVLEVNGLCDNNLSSTCSDEIAEACIKLPSLNFDEVNSKAPMLEEISEEIKDKIEKGTAVCLNNNMSKISDEKCLEGVAKDFTSSEELNVEVDEDNFEEASKLEQNLEKIQNDQIIEIGNLKVPDNDSEKNSEIVKDYTKLESTHVVAGNSKKTCFKLEQNSETVEIDQSIQANNLDSTDDNLNHTEVTKASQIKGLKATSEDLSDTELLTVVDLNEKNVEIHVSENKNIESIENKEILQVNKLGKDMLSKNLETKDLEEVAIDYDTNLENDKKELEVFINNCTTNKTADQDNKAVMGQKEESQDNKAVMEQKEESQEESGNEMEQSKEGVCVVTKSVDLKCEKRASNAQLQGEGKGPTCLAREETAVRGNGKEMTQEISETTDCNAESKQNKNIIVTSLLNCANSQMSKHIPEVKSKKVRGREVKLKNIEDAFEQYLPTKPKENKETETKTEEANVITKLQDSSNCPVNYTSLCLPEGNDQSISKKRKLNVLDLEHVSVIKETIPVSDISNREILLEEISIDASGETQLNNNKTPTQMSPLSTSPRKKERKSIEVIINHLKEEKSGTTVLNEAYLKDQPISSLEDGVDVNKLRSKLSEKIKSSNQLPTSPVKELLQSGANNTEQIHIPENMETTEVVSGKSEFNNSQSEDNNTQCDTLEFSKESDPIVEAGGDGINYLCKEFIPVTQTNSIEYNVEIEQKSEDPILVDDSKMLVSTAKNTDLKSVTTSKESSCDENSFSTTQSNVIDEFLPKKHDRSGLEKEEIIENSLNDVIESSFIDDSLHISSLENNIIGSLDPPTNRESPNLLNLSDLIMHEDSASTNVTDCGEITVSPAAVCMFPDIISTTINSSENKLSCASPTGTTKLFTFPVATEADMTEEFIPLNEVSGNDNFLDDANASTSKVGSLHESCVFSFNEQIDNSNHRTLSSPGLDLNLQYVPFSNIPIGSSQSLDLTSPKSLSMVQPSCSNNYMNDVPVDNEINEIVTEIPCSIELDDHNYILGGPLLSGRPKEESKSICPSNFDKPLDDSPNEFSLNDTQLQEFVFSENNLREIMPEDTYKLNLDNEYAVKNLVILGSQTSTDTNDFPLSNYNLADIKRINLIECSIPNSEENSNSKEYLDSTSSSLEQETENTSSNTNPWAEFIVNENPNQKVVVLSNECLTPAFSITQKDLIKSFEDKATESDQCIEETIAPILSSNSLSQKTSKIELPKKEVQLGISKINLRKNKKSVCEEPSQKDDILNDFLPKRRYSKTVTKRRSAPVRSVNETKKEITVENTAIPQVDVSSIMLKDITPQPTLSEKSTLEDNTPLLNLKKLNQVNPKKVVKVSVESIEDSSNKIPMGNLSLETKEQSTSQSYLSPIRDVLDKQLVKNNQNLTVPCISKNLSETDIKENYEQKFSENRKSPCENLLQITSINLSKVAEIDKAEVSENMQKKIDRRAATNKYSNNYTSSTISSTMETNIKTAETVKPTKSTLFDMPLLEDGMSNKGVIEAQSKIDLLQPFQECKKVSTQNQLQVQKSPAESTLTKIVPSNLTKPCAELEGKGMSSHQNRANIHKNRTLDNLDIPFISAVNLIKSKDQLTDCDLLPKKPIILPTTPAEPRKSTTSKYNYSIDSILSKGPKPCAINYKCENPVKDYRQPNNRGVKRNSSTVEDERETGKIDNRKLRRLDGNRHQPTSSKDATFDELLQQGNVNKLISLRVTEDNKLKPERRSSPSITKLYNRNKDQNEREDKLKQEKRNSPLIRSHSRNKEETERQNELKPERRNSPLVMKSFPKNKEIQSERGLNNSYFHPGYDKSKVSRRGEVEENRSESRRSHNPYQPPYNVNKTCARESRLIDGNRIREGYNSDHIQHRSRGYHPGYNKGRECHQSDHSRGKGRQHYGYASTSSQSSNNPQPTSSRSSNVSELYYSNPMSKQGTQHVDPSNIAAYQAAGPYSKRNAKMSEDKLNALLNSVKDRVLDQLGGTDRRRHKEEGEHSWIEKFNQRIPSDLLGTSNGSTPQFFPKMPSP